MSLIHLLWNVSQSLHRPSLENGKIQKLNLIFFSLTYLSPMATYGLLNGRLHTAGSQTACGSGLESVRLSLESRLHDAGWWSTLGCSVEPVQMLQWHSALAQVCLRMLGNGDVLVRMPYWHPLIIMQRLCRINKATCVELLSLHLKFLLIFLVSSLGCLCEHLSHFESTS